MPYIKNSILKKTLPKGELTDREYYSTMIHDIFSQMLDVRNNKEYIKGDMNYCIISLLCEYIKQFGYRYCNLQDMEGLMTACRNEFHDRLMRPREDEAIEKNGDLEIIKEILNG